MSGDNFNHSTNPILTGWVGARTKIASGMRAIDRVLSEPVTLKSSRFSRACGVTGGLTTGALLTAFVPDMLANETAIFIEGRSGLIDTRPPVGPASDDLDIAMRSLAAVTVAAVAVSGGPISPDSPGPIVRESLPATVLRAVTPVATFIAPYTTAGVAVAGIVGNVVGIGVESIVKVTYQNAVRPAAVSIVSYAQRDVG